MSTINSDAHAVHALRDAFDVEPTHLATLSTQLAAMAESHGLLDVAYRTMDTPVGQLLIAATSRGVVRIAFELQSTDDVLQDLADRVSPRVLLAPARLDEVAAQIDEYFTGGRRAFDIPLDWQLATGFKRLALDHLRSTLGYGQTASYGLVAERIGHPRAARAVGTACAGNPLPIVVPCHRVVRSDRRAGQYVGGAGTKLALLALEAE